MIASIMENVTIRAHNMQVAVAPNEQWLVGNGR